ncbi:hypothetical protein JCM19233_4058 [Vibrio astriarenae]|nr:hypothetical protein JCM19233_4058 [Vibrio sp. C7]
MLERVEGFLQAIKKPGKNQAFATLLFRTNKTIIVKLTL